MIKIYDSSDYSLQNCLANVFPSKANVFKNQDDEYYADLEFPHQFTTVSGRTEQYTPMLKNDNIAVIDTPWGKQCFRLGASEKSPKGFKFRAQHVSRELKRFGISERAYYYRPTLDTIANETLIRSGADSLFTIDLQVDPFVYYPESFSFTFGVDDAPYDTDISSNARRYSSTTAFGAFKFISDFYNVKLVYDNWTVIIKEHPYAVTSDVILRNAKNIDDITITENWDNVCTRCIAIGYRDLRSVYTAPSNPYACRYDRVVHFEPSFGVDVEDDEAVLTDLQYQAQAYVESHIEPEINYTVNATPDVNVDIGDPVAIKHSTLDLNLVATVSSITYNALTGKYIQVEFGNAKPNVKGFKTEITRQIKLIKLRLGQGGL